MKLTTIKKYFFSYWLSIVILLGVFLAVTYPFFHDGFFPTLDDVQVVRIDEMTKELLSGQFPVRFVNDLGNGGGYMLFSFYPPLAYYLGSSIHLVGLSLIKATKLTFLFGYLIAVTGMFLLLRLYFSKTLAVLGTSLFLVSPFFNYEVYTRGALAEFLGFCLFPITLYLFIRLIEKKTSVFFFLFGFSYAALILAHTFVGLFGTVFLVGILLLLVKRKRESIQPLLGLAFGLSATVWFWVPVFFEQSFTQYSQSYFAKQAFLTNFLSPITVIGVQVPKWDFLPPLLGIILGGFSLVGICVGLMKKEMRRMPIFLFALSGFIFSLFLISDFSKFFWLHSTFLQYMQFPWRFLVFSTVFAVILVVFALQSLRTVWLQIIVGGGMLVFSYFFYSSYLHPATYNFISQYFAEDSCGTTTWAEEYLPKSVEKCLPRSKNHEFTYSKIVTGKGVQILASDEQSHGRVIHIKSSGSKGTIALRKYFFPGWNVLIDNSSKLAVYPSKPYGLLSFTVPEGEHTIVASFEKTTIQKISELLSVILPIGITILFFVLQNGIMIKKKKNQ